MMLPLSLKALALVTDKAARRMTDTVRIEQSAGAMPVAVATNGHALLVVQWEDAPGDGDFAGCISVDALKTAVKTCAKTAGIPVDTDTGVIGFPPNQSAIEAKEMVYPQWRKVLLDGRARPTHQVFKIGTLAAALAVLEKVIGPEGAIKFSTGPESQAVAFSACRGYRDNPRVNAVGMVMSLPNDAEIYNFPAPESVAGALDIPAEKAAT